MLKMSACFCVHLRASRLTKGQTRTCVCVMAAVVEAGKSGLSSATAPGLADVVDFVAAWLPDRTPLAATARFARCSAHFRSYLVSSCSTTAVSCFACDFKILCDVRRHWHVRGRGGGFVVYQGSDEASRYVWLPANDLVACRQCACRLGHRVAAWRREAGRQENEEIADAMRHRFMELVRDAA